MRLFCDNVYSQSSKFYKLFRCRHIESANIQKVAQIFPNSIWNVICSKILIYFNTFELERKVHKTSHDQTIKYISFLLRTMTLFMYTNLHIKFVDNIVIIASITNIS